MTSDLKEFKYDYLILGILLGFGVVLYAYYRGNNSLETAIAGGMSLTYILWGIIHHSHADKVTGKIVLEYILVALFGFLVINSLLIWR
jgi:hypothetical protein